MGYVRNPKYLYKYQLIYKINALENTLNAHDTEIKFI